MSAKLLSVITPFYNRPELVRNFLLSVDQASKPSDFELILINDGSDDSLSFELPQYAKSVYQPHQGQASARNLGISLSSGKYILFLDSDVTVTDNLFHAHLEFLEKYPDCAILGNVTFPPHIIPDRITKRTDLDFFFRGLKNHQKLTFIQFLTCNLSLPAYLLKSSGGFNTSFNCYGYEDLELGYRICELGNKNLIFARNACVYHHNRRNASELFLQQYHLGKSQVTFQKLHPEITYHLKMDLYDFAIFAEKGKNPGLIAQRKQLQEKIEKQIYSSSDLEKFMKLSRFEGIASVISSADLTFSCKDQLRKFYSPYPDKSSSGIVIKVSGIKLKNQSPLSLLLSADRMTEHGEISIKTSPSCLISRYCAFKGLPDKYSSGKNPAYFHLEGRSSEQACFRSVSGTGLISEKHGSISDNLRIFVAVASEITAFPWNYLVLFRFMLSFLKLPQSIWKKMKFVPFCDAVIFSLLDKLLHIIRIIKYRG